MRRYIHIYTLSPVSANAERKINHDANAFPRSEQCGSIHYKGAQLITKCFAREKKETGEGRGKGNITDKRGIHAPLSGNKYILSTPGRETQLSSHHSCRQEGNGRQGDNEGAATDYMYTVVLAIYHLARKAGPTFVLGSFAPAGLSHNRAPSFSLSSPVVVP